MKLAVAALSMSLTAATALGPNPGEPLQSALQRAQSEQAAAEAQTKRLESVAANARSEADRLRAQQAAAAQAIETAEAGITTAETRLRLAAAYVAAHRQQLAVEQQPVSGLLAGLALMADRPPLLVIAQQRGSDELVKARILLDSTLPVIRNRTARLSTELVEARRLENAAVTAKADLARSRDELVVKRNRFAALEQKAYREALATGGEALSSGDVAIAAGEDVERLRAEQASSESIRAIALQLASGDIAPLSPFPPDGPPPVAPFNYELPAAAAVSEGLAAANDSGVRSRGLTLMTGRGMAISAPADGLVRFAGPFRNYDAVLIIDHGSGWLSVIVNAAPSVEVAQHVRVGQGIGHALGPIKVELSHNGLRFSPALIAGSSPTLSKARKAG